ncbi:MAG: polysaccharide deacetylase [Oscillospiraceae bacterium]|nr:polysaccharide deacetylase [Oscillospiraceae bacterium]
MYLGSVRFFKHLIVSIIFIIIFGLLAAVIILAAENNEKSAEIYELNQTLISFGIDVNEPVNTISNGDGQFSIEDEQPVIDSEPEPPAEPPIYLPEPITEPDPEKSPWIELFPHLYSDYIPPANFMDDSGFIYLTFDDGPSRYTGDILRYLQLHDIPATFFVMPDDTEAGKNFLNTMLDRGHEIGVHTMTHVYNDIYASVEAYLEDFNDAWNLVYEQTGYKPYLFRFPGGSINDYNFYVRTDIINEMTRRGFVYFDWNVDSRDALDASWTEMYNTVLNETAEVPRAVVLFHDRPGGYNTVLVVEDIIKALLADPANYIFSAITRETRPMQF